VDCGLRIADLQRLGRIGLIGLGWPGLA
jgi:hypothetical protein